MKLRGVINEHVMHEFKDTKERLMAKRLDAHKKQNEQEYANCISEASQSYMTMLQQRTRDSIEFLDIAEGNYRTTLNEITNDPEMRKRIEYEDNKLKTDLERREVTESKAEIRKIWLEKLKAEADLQK